MKKMKKDNDDGEPYFTGKARKTLKRQGYLHYNIYLHTKNK